MALPQQNPSHEYNGPNGPIGLSGIGGKGHFFLPTSWGCWHTVWPVKGWNENTNSPFTGEASCALQAPLKSDQKQLQGCTHLALEGRRFFHPSPFKWEECVHWELLLGKSFMWASRKNLWWGRDMRVLLDPNPTIRASHSVEYCQKARPRWQDLAQ